VVIVLILFLNAVQAVFKFETPWLFIEVRQSSLYSHGTVKSLTKTCMLVCGLCILSLTAHHCLCHLCATQPVLRCPQTNFKSESVF
jgi:hypothetical protein